MSECSLNDLAILIVEDEVLIACDIAITIEEAGGSVIGPATTLKKALALLKTEAPAGAVLDVRLGEHDVGEVARVLRARGIPFLFHTGHADASLLAEWPDAPILRKPSLPSDLRAMLLQLIEPPKRSAAV